MVKCTVENHYTALLIKFNDGKSLLIQDGTEQSDFVMDCGKEDWQDVDECPEVYYDLAEYEGTPEIPDEPTSLKAALEIIVHNIHDPKSLKLIADTATSLMEKSQLIGV